LSGSFTCQKEGKGHLVFPISYPITSQFRIRAKPSPLPRFSAVGFWIKIHYDSKFEEETSGVVAAAATTTEKMKSNLSTSSDKSLVSSVRVLLCPEVGLGESPALK